MVTPKALHPSKKILSDQPLDADPRPLALSPRALGAIQKRTMFPELRLQLVEARARRRDGLDDRRDPGAVLAELEHLEDLLHDAIGAVAVGLVHDEEVGDLHEARLDRLDVVAHPRRQDDDARLRETEDVHLVLPDADRLDEHLVEARRVEDVYGVGRGAREAAEVAARRHRPDQDAGVRVEVLHPDAVAEDRAAREGRRRVDRDDPDLPPAGARAPREGRGQRGLARPRRAREAGDAGAARLREEGARGARESGRRRSRPTKSPARRRERGRGAPLRRGRRRWRGPAFLPSVDEARGLE